MRLKIPAYEHFVFVLAAITLTSLLSHQASAQQSSYVITDQQLRELVTIQGSLDRTVRRLQREFDNPALFRDHRAHRDFMALTDSLTNDIGNGRFGLNSWIDNISRHSEPAEPVENQFVTVEQYYVVGTNSATRNQGEAVRAVESECDKLVAEIRNTIAPSTFDSFSCANHQNVSPYANIGYFQYAATPKLVLQLPSQANIEPVVAGLVAGETISTKDPGEAFNVWQKACFAWMQRQKVNYGHRFVVAACGIPSNGSSHANIGYIEYQSSGTVYVNRR